MAAQDGRDRATFLRSFVRDWKTIGSVTPSSRYLVGAMLDKIDFRRVRRIVEYGPGTGVFTGEILRRLHPDDSLLALDTEAHFIDDLNASARAYLRVRKCDVERLPKSPGDNAAVPPQLGAECTIDWITIRERKGA